MLSRTLERFRSVAAEMQWAKELHDAALVSGCTGLVIKIQCTYALPVYWTLSHFETNSVVTVGLTGHHVARATDLHCITNGTFVLHLVGFDPSANATVPLHRDNDSNSSAVWDNLRVQFVRRWGHIFSIVLDGARAH